MAAASALLALTLAGPPLYVSSATSKALQTSIAAACPGDVGVLLDVPVAAVSGLDQRAAGIANVLPPVHTEIAGIQVAALDSSAPAQLVWRDALGSTAAGSIAEPPDDQVAVPGSYAAAHAVRAGDELAVTVVGETTPRTFGVAGVFPDVPVQPEPAYWCSLRQLLRPDGSGAAPPPMFLAAQSTVRSAADGSPTTLWELHPDGDHLTRTAAVELLADYRALVASTGDVAGAGSADAITPVAGQTSSGLARLIADADQVGDATARGLIGIRLVALALAVALLAVAAAIVVAGRRQELWLRATRGEGRLALGLRVAETQAVPVLGGTVIGLAAAVLAVSAAGPSADLETSAIRTAILLAVGGLLAALAGVGLVGGVAADRLVDRDVPTRWRLTPPWEVVPIVLALVAASRLDRTAGVRIVGTGVIGGDGLAEAFPVFALTAIGAVLVRPLRWLLRRGRHGGGYFGVAALLGRRRLAADPGRHALLAGAIAAGVGATIVAASLAATTDRMVADKATTFLGADLRVVTAGEPVIPEGLDGTPISRLTGQVDGTEVQLVGIDPDSFADVVRWREDASDYPLADLLQVLAVDDMRGAPLPAVIVGGPVSGRAIRADDGVEVDITPVATAAFFPGKTSVPLVVVNRNALAADEVPAAPEVWLQDPPADATRVLAAAGNLVRGAQGVDDVFAAGSVQAVRWADQVLWAFAAFMAVVFLIGALLIVRSGAADRRAARAIGQRLGEPPNQEFGAALVALGVPAIVGAFAGLAGGLLVARIAAGHLDVGNLPPPAERILDAAPALPATAVGLGAVVLAAVAARAALGGHRHEGV